MILWPDSLVSPQERRARTRDGRDLVILSGHATFRRAPAALHRGDLHLALGPRWRRLDGVAPLVSLAARADDPATAGWPIGQVEWTTLDAQILLRSPLAARDLELAGVAYHITAIGLVEPAPARAWHEI